MNVVGWLKSVEATRSRWQALLAGLDIAGIVLATVLTYYARFEGTIPLAYSKWLPLAMLVSAIVYVGFALVFGLYRVVLRYVGVDTLLRTVGAVSCGAASLIVLDMLAALVTSSIRPVPLGVVIIQSVFVLFALAAVRIAVRAGLHLRATGDHDGQRLVIVGAGSAGSLLLRELQSRPALGIDVVGFLDDNPGLTKAIIGGVPVLGTVSDLERIVEVKGVHELFVALPAADPEYIRSILNRAADLNLVTRVMPKLVIEKGTVDLADMRKVDVEDLLGRELTPIDINQVAQTLSGKVVAVTGAAGSIGSELCRQIVVMKPAKVLLCEIDESRLYELWFELESLAPGVCEMHLLDIRDALKVNALFAMAHPDVVLHAAAYKHVPLMELEPAEAIRTNVLGTAHVMQAAAVNGAQRFVLISTDKAVSPVNVMGKTKQLAERLMLSFAKSTPSMTCVAVRFGNVLGSRGSVVPIFEEKLLRGEPLTVTDPEVTRYFMVIPEAARLVLQAQAIGASGDIFVLEMGSPVRIVDLARKMIALSGIPADIVFTGLRPGEKLHEILINDSEELEPTGSAKITRVKNLGITAMDDETFALLIEMSVRPGVTPQSVLGL